MKIILPLALLIAIASANPISTSIRARGNFLKRQSDSQCASDSNCQNAISGFNSCLVSGATQQQFLSCFCQDYTVSLATCYTDGCSVGQDGFNNDRPYDQSIVDSCVLYQGGDPNDAYSCDASQDPNSPPCLEATAYITDVSVVPASTSTPTSTYVPPASSTPTVMSSSVTPAVQMSTSSSTPQVISVTTIQNNNGQITSGSVKFASQVNLFAAVAALVSAFFIL